MKPILFKFLIPFTSVSIPIYSYETLRVIGFIIGFTLLVDRGIKLNLHPQRILTASFWGLIFSFLGARVFYVIQYYPYYFKHPVDAIKMWEGGSVYYGGFIGGFLFLYIYCRKTNINIWKYLDVSTPSFALGMAFARIGCFFAGCCYGTISSLPWSVSYPKGSIAYYGQIEDLILIPPANQSLPVHPVQLYEALGCFLISMYILMRTKKLFDGYDFFTFVGFYAILRFVLEYFRADRDRGYFIEPYISVSQGISLIILLFLFLVFVIKMRQNITSHHLNYDIA